MELVFFEHAGLADFELAAVAHGLDIQVLPSFLFFSVNLKGIILCLESVALLGEVSRRFRDAPRALRAEIDGLKIFKFPAPKSKPNSTKIFLLSRTM